MKREEETMLVEVIRAMVSILSESSAGLDISHPEYYERQKFVVLPAKYFLDVITRGQVVMKGWEDE